MHSCTARAWFTVRAVKREIATNLRRIRTEQGLSVQALARQSGIARATLIALEAGTANPTLETLMSIGEALGIQASLLLANDSPATRLVRAKDDDESPLEEDFGVVRILDQMTAVATMGLMEGQLYEGEEFTRAARGDQPGSYAFLFVLDGRLLVGPASAPVEVSTGDYLRFQIDQPYVMRALGGTARFFSGVCSTRAGDLNAMLSRGRHDPTADRRIPPGRADERPATKRGARRKVRG